MKKFKYILGISLLSVAATSCDFLDREPLDFGDENAYFKTADDLALSANDFYDALPKMEYLWGGLYEEDNSSDNQSGNWANNLFYPGDKKTVQQNQSEWKFENLRSINFFLTTVKQRMDAGAITGSTEYINHYYGEGFFGTGYGTYKAVGKDITTYIDGEKYLTYYVKSLSNDNAEITMYDNNGDSMDLRVKKVN